MFWNKEVIEIRRETFKYGYRVGIHNIKFPQMLPAGHYARMLLTILRWRCFNCAWKQFTFISGNLIIIYRKGQQGFIILDKNSLKPGNDNLPRIYFTTSNMGDTIYCNKYFSDENAYGEFVNMIWGFFRGVENNYFNWYKEKKFKLIDVLW